MDRLETIRQSVIDLSVGTFKATGLKVEFESQLNRGKHISHECNRDRSEDDTVADISCSNCDSEGWLSCDYCDGEGNAEDEDGDYYDCDECDGGRVQCSYCDEAREHARNTCSVCWAINYYSSPTNCHDFLLERLVPLGLAEPLPEGASYSYSNKFRPVRPLVFSKFYRDGSVDSEWTLTIEMTPDAVMLLPQLTEMWNELSRAIGNTVVTTGAGLHMALINSPDAGYPDATNYSESRYRNFKRSMTPLLPALYFLGTTNEHTRGLGYRRPQVTCYELGDSYSGNSKYSAISYRHGAVEFRVFDTCYDNPQAILDNVVVMRNAMKYWSDHYTPPKGFSTIQFGNDRGDTLERLYKTVDHIDTLNLGLKRLKPAYFTIKDIKLQRKFTVTKRDASNLLKTATKEATVAYKEYEDRFEWKLRSDLFYEVGNIISGNREVSEDAARVLAEQRIANRRVSDKKPLNRYVEEQVRNIERNNRGEYELAV